MICNGIEFRWPGKTAFPATLEPRDLRCQKAEMKKSELDLPAVKILRGKTPLAIGHRGGGYK